MNIWLLLLTFFNVVLLAGLSLSLFLRLKERKEDQRLTRGLQLLQNKISILEDLSDKTDEQVRKLIHILDQKTSQVRQVVALSDEQIKQTEIMLDKMLTKSLEISSLNHDQTPLAEKQNQQKTNQYVLAAKLASQGVSLEQIAGQVDLSPAELQMIIKVNKPQITESVFNPVEQDLVAQTKLTAEFKKTIQQMPQTFTDSSASIMSDGKKVTPFEFRRLTGR